MKKIELKNSSERFNISLDKVEERIGELQDMAMEFIRRMQNEKKWRQPKDIKRTNIYVIEVSEREDKETESLYEEVMTKHFPNWEKETNIRIQEPREFQKR